MPKTSMKNILWWELAVNKPLHDYTEFVDIARLLGVSITPIDMEVLNQSEPNIVGEKLISLIQEADGYILSDNTMIYPDQTESFIPVLLDEIAKGKKMLVLSQELSLNSFLSNFDISISENRIITEDKIPGTQGRTIIINTKYQLNPVSKMLMQGVTTVTAHSPRILQTCNRALPFLTCPKGSFVYTMGDWIEGTEEDLSCGGVYIDKFSSSPTVIAISAAIFINPYQSIGGYFFEGVRANRTFANNILHWLNNTLKSEIELLIEKGESKHLEFKSSFTWDLKAREKNEYRKGDVLKTIAAFSNTRGGGTLLIGVQDDGSISGIAKDAKTDDKFLLALSSSVIDTLGIHDNQHCSYKIIKIGENKICKVDVKKGDEVIYYDHKLYIRHEAQTRALPIEKIAEYVHKYWGE